MFQEWGVNVLQFVEVSVLNAIGYQSRDIARETFYRRAVCLHHFDIENDQISLVQALLLLTYWVERPLDEKDSWFWLFAAKNLVQKMDIPVLMASSRTSKVRSLLKRLFWCSHMRESILSLGANRPIMVGNDACLMPAMTLDDFDITESQTGPVLEMDYSPSSSTSEAWIERSMALICIEMSKLCLCIKKVLWVQSTSAVLSRTNADGPFNFLKGITPDSVSAEFRSCDKQLTEWFTDLPPEALIVQDDSTPTTTAEASLAVHQILLQMTYFAVVNTLYVQEHRFVPESPPTSRVDTEIYKFSSEKMLYAARRVSRLSETLLRHNLTSRLPPFWFVVSMSLSF